MSIMNKEEAKRILEKVLRYSKADGCQATLNSSISGNIRYALNTVTTAGSQINTTLAVQANFGKQLGTATINEFDDASLERGVRRAEELAKYAPENPEFMPFLGAQEYQQTKAFFDKTAQITPAYRSRAAGYSIKPSREKKLTAAGFLQDRAGFQSLMNSAGCYAHHTATTANFTVTIRTKDGTGSGWASRDVNDITKLDTGSASEIAIEKALTSRQPKAIEPGKYTVILEPAAGIGLINPMMNNFGARQADEGRSFLAKKGGGTKLGERIVDERISITSDPSNPDVPTSPWSNDGRARKKTDWIKNGVVSNLSYSRYWAQQKNVASVPGPPNIIMAGGDASLEDMIKDTRRGILVTRLWYIRQADPQTLLYTGLTRDGTFFIENGKIKHPIANFRFNESPVIMLNNLEALGKPQRINGNLIPPMKIRDFTFSSSSDAV